MLVSYFWSCLHPNSSSLLSLCYRCSSSSPKHWIVWGKLQNRRASRVWVKWKEFLFIFLWSRIYNTYAFSLSTWCFDMKLLKVLRSESMERPGLKISTNSHIFKPLYHNKMTSKWEESEFIDPKAEIICKSRKKLHRTRYLARSFSLFNTIAAFYTHSVQGWAIDRALMCDGCFPSNDIAYMEI